MGAARSLKVRYTQPASVDLDEALTWIAQRSPRGARKVHARIKAVVDLLRRHPEAGRASTRSDTRVMATTPYPYVIFYTVDADTVTIHAIRHTARDPTSMR